MLKILALQYFLKDNFSLYDARVLATLGKIIVVTGSLRSGTLPPSRCHRRSEPPDPAGEHQPEQIVVCKKVGEL